MFEKIVQSLGGLKSFYTTGKQIEKAEPAEIAKFEKKEKLQFPDDYRAFLTEINGGRFPVNPGVGFDVEGRRALRVYDFSNFKLKDSLAMLPTEWEGTSIIYPRYVFPIVSIAVHQPPNDERYSPPDPEFNGVFLFLDGKKRGGVFIIGSEYAGSAEYSDEELLSDENVIQVADSFTEFMGKLRKLG